MEIDDLRYVIRPARAVEWEDAMLLVWKTFMKYDAADYSKEGVANFADFITDETLHKLFIKGDYEMFVAISNNQIIGVITLRDKCHISLLFVREHYQRKGIGESLVKTLKKYVMDSYQRPYLTVNAAPYGIAFYHALGFVDVGAQTVNKGIAVSPMRLE